MVAAVAEEARYVPDRIPVLVTGIGKTAAAVAVTRALSAQEDLSDLVVLNIGTAGALHGGMTGLHAPVAVINHDISAEAIRSLGHDPKERIQLRIGEGPVLATGDVFVADPAVRDKLAERADLVDMEGYAVAYAASAFKVPVRMLKHVSDNADEHAITWSQQVDASARVLGAALEELLAD